MFNCDPEGTRTPNQQNRNLPFYPIELRGRNGCKNMEKKRAGEIAMNETALTIFSYSNFDLMASISFARAVFSSSAFLCAALI